MIESKDSELTDKRGRFHFLPPGRLRFAGAGQPFARREEAGQNVLGS